MEKLTTSHSDATIEIDLAKQIVQVNGIDGVGEIIIWRSLRCRELL
jgi:hypothetical protein